MEEAIKEVGRMADGADSVRADLGGATRFAFPLGLVGALVAFGTALGIVLASVVTGMSYHAVAFDATGPVLDFIATGTLVALLYLIVAGSLHKVTPQAPKMSRLATAWLAAFSLLAVCAFLLKTASSFSRGSVISFFVVGGLVAVVTPRASWRAVRRLVETQAVAGSRVVVLYERSELEDGLLFRDLRQQGYRVVGSYCMNEHELSNVLNAIRKAKTDEILLLVSWSRKDRIDQLVDAMRSLPLPVRLLASARLRPLLTKPTVAIGAALAVELRRAPLSTPERFVKRSVDLLGASTLLMMFFPLLMLVGLLVRLDSCGPILFRQTRVGFNGRPFSIYKFRTMTVLEDGAEIRQVTTNDPRVTRIGRILRRTSVDELPQLLNVLRGEMSLVGPRPHASAHDNKFNQTIADYALRHHVKPGITGWAQIKGFRGETRDEESILQRVRHDLWYIDNWTLQLELRILLRTPRALLIGVNAH